MPRENPQSRNVSGSKLNKNAYIAMLALEDYGYTGSYTLTSMHRTPEVNSSEGVQGVSDSLHLTGNAVDIGKKPEDDKELAEWIKTDEGKKWMEDFNVYHEDEGDHHHFGFKDVEDTSSIANYDKYEKGYNLNKNEDDEFVAVDPEDIDNTLSWAAVSPTITETEIEPVLDEVYVIDYDSAEPITMNGKNVDANSEEGQILIADGTGYSETKSQYEARQQKDPGVVEKMPKPKKPRRRDYKTTPEFRKAEREYYKKLDKWEKAQEKEEELRPEDIVTDEEEEIKEKETIQLAIGKGDKGHLSNEQQNKLEELGIELQIRTDENGLTFYEIKADDKEEADKIMIQLNEAGFENHFIVEPTDTDTEDQTTEDQTTEDQTTEDEEKQNISHTIHLAVEKDGRGGLTNDQQNKLEELGITLNKRTDSRGITYYEVDAKDLNEANEIIKKLEDNNFEDTYIKHTKTDSDGSTKVLTDRQLYKETGEISHGFSSKNYDIKSDNISELYKDNIYAIDKAKENDYGTYTKPSVSTNYHTIWDPNTKKNYYIKKENYAKLSKDDENIKGGEKIVPGIYQGGVNLKRKEEEEKTIITIEGNDYSIGDTLPDGSVFTNIDENNQLIVTDPDGASRIIPVDIDRDEKDPIYIPTEVRREENPDGSTTVTYSDQSTQIESAPVVETDVVETDVVETPEVTTEEEGPNLMEKIGSGVGATLKGAGTLLDSIGGPSAIISYIMGKEGLKHAMKEIEPQKMPELSPLFHQHLRQTKELAKKGFHPAEARKIRKEIDSAYEQGLDNAVRGTSGDRAKFLAQSGILDSKRSSALLDFATQDAALQRENQDKYVDTMMFKENFEAQRSEKLRAEDMQMQMANKQSAAQFTSAAFSNLMSGLGGGNSALIRQMMQMYQGGGTGTKDLFNTVNPNQ